MHWLVRSSWTEVPLHVLSVSVRAVGGLGSRMMHPSWVQGLWDQLSNASHELGDVQGGSGCQGVSVLRLWVPWV